MSSSDSTSFFRMPSLPSFITGAASSASPAASVGMAAAPASWASSSTVMWIAAIVLVGVIGYMCWSYFGGYLTKVTNGFRPNNEHKVSSSGGASGNGKTAELMLFYANWCPNCTDIKPDWKQLREQYDGQLVNGYRVVFTEVDSESPDGERLMNQYGVDGFPTVKLIHDGMVTDLTAKPNYDNLKNFLNQVLKG